MTLAQLERQVRLLKVYAAVMTAFVVLSAWFVVGHTQSQRPRFTEIDVERINIVEPDGRLALVVANTQRMPGPILDGKELARELSQGRTGSAGLLFVDAQGNEVGGLSYRAEVKPDGSYTADRSLTFDQHNQDQVVGLQYGDNGKTRGSGLSVWDRPTTISLKEILAAAQGTTDRQVLEKRFLALLKERGETSPGARRVFLGSQDRTAALRLMDTTGRERFRVVVDASNTARLEFLDEAGKVVYALPDSQR